MPFPPALPSLDAVRAVWWVPACALVGLLLGLVSLRGSRRTRFDRLGTFLLCLWAGLVAAWVAYPDGGVLHPAATRGLGDLSSWLPTPSHYWWPITAASAVIWAFAPAGLAAMLRSGSRRLWALLFVSLVPLLAAGLWWLVPALGRRGSSHQAVDAWVGAGLGAVVGAVLLLARLAWTALQPGSRRRR